MRILVAFVLGAACGAAMMFYLVDRGSVLPAVQSYQGNTVQAAAMDASPAHAATAVPPKDTQDANVGVLPAAVVRAAPALAATLPEAASATSVAAAGRVSIDLTGLPASAVNGLLIPVVGVSAADLTDTFTQARGAGRVHDAIDIMAARGTPVVAANDGHVVKLFNSKPGGLTVYEFDPQDQVIYYYAHLDSYAAGLAEGQLLHRGDPIGFVGSTGNASADAPHLHFEIQILGPEKQWWHATSINPYGRFDGQRVRLDE